MSKTSKRRRRAPRWAFWTVVFGTVLLVGGGGGAIGLKATVAAATSSIDQTTLIGSAAPAEEKAKVSLDGPKNLLLVGIDQRPDQTNGEPLRSDSIILLHINKDHTSGYMISLPRDSYVNIPAYDNGAQKWGGGRTKINAAFAFGTRGLKGDDALKHGFELLTMTVKELTGITPDAGAIIDFQGFRDVVNVLGRVCMYVDTTTKSIHLGKDAKGNTAHPYAINPNGTLNHKIAGVTPNIYKKGNQCFSPSQALDFVRQRDLLEDNSGDYGRQRHQQQFFRAIINQAMKDGLDSPTKLPKLLGAFGKAMTVDTRGVDLADWALSMRSLKPDKLITIKSNEGKLNSQTIPGVGSAEILSPDTMDLLKSLKRDDVATFLLGHPKFVATS
ncbi:cell envelope-related transcriptional attenuator [Actinoplanes sp. SE50]|uniref:LCP family protein n=1 Tax=unclassified Actinoplanes TaxID=2626549 RepID=UPI00023EBEC4|nr:MULTISPECIES: LCP family protein [unclassified Actinoplanes]AEV82946.1 cell envelope-related transcriptional attenuator [Actinoplanes sp. SE50/110]ATO81342.1 cell envelope-related transcriptional attenuator [Actinoplanes sp. SE50]SLL98749.1 cell envelope-related transcriptional attenuator [Actinoplanes sp. SE50/110]